MRDENGRGREKFELSLDGRQIASIVVGALVILGVVFVLGLNVGKQIAVRQAATGRGGDLEALDHPPPPASATDDAITFYDRLPKAKPAAPPPAEPKAVPAPAPLAETAAAPALALAEEPAPALPRPAPLPAIPAPAVAASATPKVATRPPAAAEKAGAWCVQLAASSSRVEADRLAARFRSLSPRVETADVPGKGRFFRVRVGSFETKDDAERYRSDVARETGAKGYVTASR
jgi:DedD protein